MRMKPASFSFDLFSEGIPYENNNVKPWSNSKPQTIFHVPIDGRTIPVQGERLCIYPTGTVL
jgi:hypothetical protein